ncbi:MAG: division/cell wall cluster transcriptional repressor MraZ, partial [Ruminococcus sp.]|nr:division/cell wall cluster transcriptional repressor MraZ [Ruminococcus sp.]
KLREDAGLSGEVTVVGMDSRIEIWDKETFTAFMEQQKQASVKEALELLRL